MHFFVPCLVCLFFFFFSVDDTWSDFLQNSFLILMPKATRGCWYISLVGVVVKVEWLIVLNSLWAKLGNCMVVCPIS